jgi:cellulose synthase/poly-beta-1,6-N-acetylglucosamine synthase-like glycosyltransferase
MVDVLLNMVIILYFVIAGGLMLYGLNCYVMIFLYKRRSQAAAKHRESVLSWFETLSSPDDLPPVTTQIPVFNELNVVERVMRAAGGIQYPRGKHEIQILDDSTDETSELIDRVAADLRGEGVDITVFRRTSRLGFKAGALAEGLTRAKGDLIAVFDADFVPPEDYLLRTVPFFLSDSRLGLVQARWGHLNRHKSMLTRVQSIGIDGHFMIEQSARSWNDLYMNFNGTAGIWRRQAIKDGGGWQWDTLTEDMDLSYRVQFAGWKALFLPDLVVPAEIPEDVNAFKSQQFRWAKGSIETAMKLLPGLLRSSVPLFKKIEAFFHLTHYMVHPLMVSLALLALPVLMSMEASIGPFIFGCLVVMLILSMMAPSALYVASQKAAYPDWASRMIYLPFLICVGVGIAVSNTRAVFEALIKHQSGFIRTPKKGDRQIKNYRIRLPFSAVIEILLGIYCAWSLAYYLEAGKYLIGPFLAIYACGFLFIGLLTVVHGSGFFD